MVTVNRDAAFVRAAQVVMTFLREPQIQIQWKQPSALDRMTIGMLACHLARQILVAQKLVAEEAGSGPLLQRVDEHYSRAHWVRAKSLDDPANDRSRDEHAARLGYAAMIEEVTLAEANLRERLETGFAYEIVPLPWQGWRLRRGDFLLTRMLEMVVHSDDLARSIHRPMPEFPDDVFDPVAALLLRLSTRRHGQSAVVSALSRVERMPATLSAFGSS